VLAPVCSSSRRRQATKVNQGYMRRRKAKKYSSRRPQARTKGHSGIHIRKKGQKSIQKGTTSLQLRRSEIHEGKKENKYRSRRPHARNKSHSGIHEGKKGQERTQQATKLIRNGSTAAGGGRHAQR
jgi:hypothetical protein